MNETPLRSDRLVHLRPPDLGDAGGRGVYRLIDHTVQHVYLYIYIYIYIIVIYYL